MAQRGLRAADLAAIGITNQRETTVAVGSQHRRAGAQRASSGRIRAWRDLVAEFARDGRRRTASAPRPACRLPPISAASRSAGCWTTFPARAQRPKRATCCSAPSIPSWLWQLTGGMHITDVTNASRTQLMNLETLDWDHETAGAFGIPRADAAARSRSSSEVYGEATLDAVAGVPVAGILGDQQAALVGQACFRARRSQKHVRHRMFSADEHRRRGIVRSTLRPAHHGGVPAGRRSRRTTRWKAAWPSPARWCSGFATTSG